MKFAYISIGLNNGKKVQYVRDVVTDSKGTGERQYGYEGRGGFQGLGLDHINYDREALGLISDEDYYFKVNIDSGGVQEYSIKAEIDRIDPFTKKGKISWLSIINSLNRATNSDGARWYISNHGDIRCESMSESAGTSIALSVGTTGTDFFNSIKGFNDFEAPVAGDQLADQTDAGEVVGDYNTIIGFIDDEVKQADLASKEVFLQFPESDGNTKDLIRKNNDDSKWDVGKTITRVPINSISEITIVEKSHMM